MTAPRKLCALLQDDDNVNSVPYVLTLLIVSLYLYTLIAFLLLFGYVNLSVIFDVLYCYLKWWLWLFSISVTNNNVRCTRRRYQVLQKLVNFLLLHYADFAFSYVNW